DESNGLLRVVDGDRRRTGDRYEHDDLGGDEGARNAQLVRVGANVGDANDAGRIRSRGINRYTKPNDRVRAILAALKDVRSRAINGLHGVVINAINMAVRTWRGADAGDRASTVH